MSSKGFKVNFCYITAFTDWNVIPHHAIWWLVLVLFTNNVTHEEQLCYTFVKFHTQSQILNMCMVQLVVWLQALWLYLVMIHVALPSSKIVLCLLKNMASSGRCSPYIAISTFWTLKKSFCLLKSFEEISTLFFLPGQIGKVKNIEWVLVLHLFG